MVGLAVVFALAHDEGEGSHQPRPAATDTIAGTGGVRRGPARDDSVERRRGESTRLDPLSSGASDSSDAADAFDPGTEPDREPRRKPGSDLRHGDRVESIVLDSIRDDRRASAIELAGSDPEGPRDLLAWRVKRGRFAIVARGSSDSDGSLEFPGIVAPRDGIEIVVTGADSVPGLPGASEPRRLPPRDPYAPQATVVAATAGEMTLRIFPREATGDVLLADSYGVVFASYPVPSSPLAAHRVIDVALNVTGSNAVVLLAHEFSDGRASDWSVLQLSAPETDAAAAN